MRPTNTVATTTDALLFATRREKEKWKKKTKATGVKNNGHVNAIGLQTFVGDRERAESSAAVPRTLCRRVHRFQQSPGLGSRKTKRHPVFRPINCRRGGISKVNKKRHCARGRPTENSRMTMTAVHGTHAAVHCSGGLWK